MIASIFYRYILLRGPLVMPVFIVLLRASIIADYSRLGVLFTRCRNSRSRSADDSCQTA